MKVKNVTRSRRSTAIVCKGHCQPSLNFWPAGMLVSCGALATALWAFCDRGRHRRACLMDYRTGLFNVHGFHVEAKREISRCRRKGAPITVGFMDCDDFKSVNDSRGHRAGDAVLALVAQTARACLRDEDILARFGGDEFVIALPETGEREANPILHRLHRRLAAAMMQRGWPITFSLGAVTLRHPTQSVDQMIQKADEVMYQIKGAGKNQFRLAVV